jgi:hypothetical protein
MSENDFECFASTGVRVDGFHVTNSLSYDRTLTSQRGAQPIDSCPLQRQAQLGSHKGHITRNLPCPCMPVSCHLRR